MIKRRLLWLLIGFMALQLFVPGYLVFRNYDTLKTGDSYKFIVNPYDPYDPFRGRYVELRPAERAVFKYTPLGRDERGFAKILPGSSDRPISTGVYAKNLRLNRYYMNESMAPIAERVQRNLSDDDYMYLLVKVKGGHYVIEGLYINDIPIERYISGEAG